MRPIRSIMIGDTDHYFSPYMFGVAQACGRLGIWHSQISIRLGPNEIDERIKAVQPDIIWTHMLLWPPRGGKSAVETLISFCQREKARGAHVFLHDGDVKARTRHPSSLKDFISVALCNHKHDRSAWQIPTLYWPYAAFVQDELATSVEAFSCDLFFAGNLSGGIYAERTRLVEVLKNELHMKVFDGSHGNTMFRTPEISASALGVLGFGRPKQADWIDTRVFQYPGSGAILVHDDVRDVLEPWVHYIPYETGSVESIIEVVNKLKSMEEKERMKIRMQAMELIQRKHSWVARVRRALAAVGMRP